MEEKIKVLILEDLPSDVELAERELKAVLNQYQIMITDTKSGFINALEDFNPDLVISDYMLPAFNGMKALHITRKKDEFIPFIILTGSMNEETAVECLKAGADDYVIKEHISRLGPAVISALDKKKIRQDRQRAEEQLKESEEIYRLIFESTGTATIMVDEQTTILQANTECGRITGYSPEELVGTSWTSYVYKEDLLKLLENSKIRKENPSLIPNKYEIRLLNSNKEIRNAILSIGFIPESNRSIVSMIDITKRKQAEKELKESESKYRMLFEHSPQGIYIADAEGHILDGNQGLLDILGSPSLAATQQIHLLSFPPLVKNGYANSFQHCVNTGEIQTFDMPYTSNWGKKFHLETHLIPLKNKNGDVEHIYTLMEDITERKQAEKELIKLSTAVEQSPSIITITDPNGNIEYVNPKFTEITGYSKEEAIGKNPRLLKSGEHPMEMYKELWGTISSGKTYRCEMHNKKKNGELFWESASISPIIDSEDNILRYVKVAEDITQQKRNEQIQTIIHHITNAVIAGHSLEKFLEIVKEQLGKLIETTNFYVALYDEKTDRISLPMHQDEKDRWESYPVGKTLSNYVIKTGKSLLAKKEIKEKLIQSGKVEQIGHPSKVWLGVPLKSENKITGIFAVQSYDNENAFDEEDVKMLEIISIQISLSLNRLKAEEDLKRAKEKAEESNRLKTAFLNNMSHEIRTPLNGITGFIKLLQNTEVDDDEKQTYFDIINESSNRLIDTVTDIIDISKIEAGQVEIVKAEVSVTKILEEHHKYFYQEAKSKGIKLILKHSPKVKEIVIITDKHKLEGILTNLIKNAIKFTDKGSITIGYSIKTLGEKNAVEIYVKDTGIGIPANRIDAIFNRFEQADIADTRAFQGSGLGLSICKSYVEMMGGKISVKSMEGEGSTFTFNIPYTEALKKEKNTQENLQKEPQSSLSHLSVIVAEDDETNILFYQTIFKETFRKVTYTTTGRETIEKFREMPDTDVILMDIQMPDINGYKATHEIRKISSEVVIIAQTAYALSSDREKALEAGCNDYIAKPIKESELLAMIEKLTRK